MEVILHPSKDVSVPPMPRRSSAKEDADGQVGSLPGRTVG